MINSKSNKLDHLELAKANIHTHLLRAHLKYNFGYFYIAFNKSMPGWIKIGISKKKVKYRMLSLSQSTPTDFIVLYSEKIPMFTTIEANIKNQLYPSTINRKGKKYKRIYPHGREWIYYGNNPKLSVFKNKSWNSRGELVEKLKNMIKDNISNNFEVEEMYEWDKDYIASMELSGKQYNAYCNSNKSLIPKGLSLSS